MDDREELLLRKLGRRAGAGCANSETTTSPAGAKGGRVMSPRALDAFLRFLEEATFPAAKNTPSVFLTDRGGIELCWEDPNGKSVQVEFTGTGAEFYDAATDEEGTVASAAWRSCPTAVSVTMPLAPTEDIVRAVLY